MLCLKDKHRFGQKFGGLIVEQWKYIHVVSFRSDSERLKLLNSLAVRQPGFVGVL